MSFEHLKKQPELSCGAAHAEHKRVALRLPKLIAQFAEKLKFKSAIGAE